MKILAVIPARAGSKGIPNKNIRFLNGRPLVAYAIENAKRSKLITDIVVTTDSPEVKIIAKQMGVSCRERPTALCGDAITLDAVIYDAAQAFDADYIVTLQPTSPTLKVETLDAAISYCIQEELDTLISAINHPHLAWTEEDGVKKPTYQERRNRQYLPPYYSETGAFLITKRSAMKVSSRIGTKVDVYEVPPQEAIDIDTFEDLRCAETILTRKRVAIYVNGNHQRGLGHVYRVLELADEFTSKPVLYYDSNQTDRRIFGETTHTLIPVNGIGALLPILEEEQYDIFINDILATSIDYMIAVRTALPKAKIINFEDDGEGAIKADLVINALYQESHLPQEKVGERHYIAPRLFLLYDSIQIKEKVERVFVSFGGADPQNYTDRLLALLAGERYRSLQFSVVLGRAKANVEELMAYNRFPNIEVWHDVRNMPEIMSACDLGIISRGRTGFELAMLGIPAIAMAQNSCEEKHGFVNNDNGFCYLGKNPSDSTIAATLDMYIAMSRAERLRYQTMLLGHDLKSGRKRVMDLINQL